MYTANFDYFGNTISIKTDLGDKAARRFAEFEAERVNVSISTIFNEKDGKVYVFRLRAGGCLEDAPVEDKTERFKDGGTKTRGGCPHSRRGSPATCSMCVQAMEKASLVEMIKKGLL